MAVGEGVNILSDSYLAFGKESTLGTGVTSTAGLDFLSANLKMLQESKTLEQVSRKRTMVKNLRMGRVLEGDVEFYYYPRVTACSFLLANAFGGTVTSATATGETAGGSAFSHTFAIGNMDQNTVSLSANMRKGPTAGQVFEYTGLRVNTLGFAGELEEPLKANVSLIGIDASVSSNDVESALTVTSADCLSFENGRFSAELTFASLTSSSFWHVQSLSFELNNNLKSDNESRRIGSDLLQVLPVGMASFNLSATIRFDTSTAFDAMLADTTYAAEFEFLGDTLGTSVIREGIKLRFPKLKISDAGDPEVPGPDGILTSEVVFQVLRDGSSAAGYAVEAVVTNDIASV